MVPSMYVCLRRIEREDIPLLWEWSMNDELAYFNAFTSHKSKAQFEIDYEANINNQSLMDYLIIAGEDKKPVGFCGLKDINWVDSYAEVFISICDENARKRGVATIAILMLVKIAFYERNLNKLIFKISEHNTKVMNLIKKWGFKHEGTLREMHYLNNRYYNIIIFGVLKSEAEVFFNTAIKNIVSYLFPGADEETYMQIEMFVQNIIGLNGSLREKKLAHVI